MSIPVSVDLDMKPEFEFSTTMAPDLANKEIDDEFFGVLSFEVVGKNKYGVTLKLKSLYIEEPTKNV